MRLAEGRRPCPSLRERIQLSEEELRDFLDNAHTLQVASIGPDGRPHLVPMWFVVDAEGCIVFTTYRTSQKVRNIERDPRVTLLIEDGSRLRQAARRDDRGAKRSCSTMSTPPAT